MTAVRREIVLPVEPSRVWEAITEPEQIRTWFGAEVEWELRPGGAGRFLEEDGSVREGRVGEIDPEHHLRFTWWPEGCEDDATEVAYDVEEVDAGTRLVVTETRASAQPAADTWSPWDGRSFAIWARWAEARSTIGA